MRTARLIARRSRVRSSLLAAMLAVVAVVTFLLVGSVGFVAGATDAAVQRTLPAGPATSGALQLKALLASDAQGQAEAVGQLIADTMTDATVHRTVRSNPVAATLSDAAGVTAGPDAVGPEVEVILAADPSLRDHTVIVDGAWPTTADEVAMQVAAAEALELEVGDTITVEDREFTVTATWLPNDPTERHWFADPAVASGFDGLSLGPVMLDEAALVALPVRNYALWTVVPGNAAMTADDLPALAQSIDALRLGVERFGGSQNLELAGGLGERVAGMQHSVGVAGGLVAVPIALVGVIGLIALTQLSRLLVSVRRGDTALLRARGASVVQLTVLAAVEAAVVAGLGAVAGVGLVVAATITGMVAVGPAGWAIAAAVAAAVVLLNAVVGWHGAMRGVGDRGDSGRTTAGATAAATVLVVVTAALSLWQYKLYGSPLTTDSDGVLRVDPLTVLAPALTLLALALLGLFAFGPVARILERLGAHGRGILPVLPGRQVARRVSVFGVVMLLVTLSASGTTAAAVYSQTWTTADRTAAQLTNGADTRVSLSTAAAVNEAALTTVPYVRMPGVADAATVVSTTARITEENAAFTALSAERIPAVMNAVDGAVDTEQLASELAAERTGAAVTGTELTLQLSATAPEGQQAGRIAVQAWLDDADGSIVLVSLGSVALADALRAGGEVSGVLPQGRADEWRVLAVQATLTGADGARDINVTVAGLDREYLLALSSAEATSRVTTFPETDALAVVVTGSLAARYALDPGSIFTVRLPNTASEITAVVVGQTEAIPGSAGHGIIADLPSLNRHLLSRSARMPQPNEVWLAADAGADLVRPAVEVSHSAARVTTVAGLAGNEIVVPAITVLWWGMAGALLLAVIAIVAITRTFAADRRGEVVVLRVLGMSPSEQGRGRLIELATVLGGALVLGIVTGVVASVLTVTELATTAGGLVMPGLLRFDVLGWVTLVFATIAAIVTISLGYAGRVARQARDSEYREETR